MNCGAGRPRSRIVVDKFAKTTRDGCGRGRARVWVRAASTEDELWSRAPSIQFGARGEQEILADQGELEHDSFVDFGVKQEQQEVSLAQLGVKQEQEEESRAELGVKEEEEENATGEGESFDAFGARRRGGR